MTRFRVALFLLVGVALALALPAFAQPQIKRDVAHPIDSVEGVDLYNAYCAVCHGKDGKGRGPAAPALKDPIPDLTLLAKQNNGKFSSVEVEDAITGRGQMVPAHGSADMPIWGPVFRALSPDEGARMLRLTNLVRYIESMQQK
jgi:mono/diheme cytochrome c family protein